MKDHNVKQYPITLTGMAGGIGSTRFYYAASGGGGSSPKGQQEYITPGTHTWTCPAGVTSVSVVCIGGGGTGGAYGGSGGSLAYKNDITVVPGQTYTIIVGNTNSQVSGSPYSFTAESSSAFNCVASGGEGGYSGSASSTRKTIGSGYDGGGRGGLASGDFYQGGIGYKEGAGGGAGGYSGDGGDAGKGAADGTSGSPAATAGSGGGGGGGCPGTSGSNAGGGGGTGIYGQGTSGAAAGGNSDPFGKGGSGGGDGTDPYGGQYGGGSAGQPGSTTPNMNAQHGAVRIIWPGTTRQFPNTGTADASAWPFDLSTASFDGKAPHYNYTGQVNSNTTGFFLKPDGTAFYTMNSSDDKVRRHNMTTAWDITTCSYNSVSGSGLTHPGGGPSKGLYFKSDGTKLFYIDTTHIRAYNLSTAWDITTLSAASDSHDFSSNLAGASSSLNFKPDGTKFYISETSGTTNNYILEYNLSTAWDLSTASYVHKDNCGGELDANTTNNIRGFAFGNNGAYVHISSAANTYGRRLSLSTPWDISTLSTSNAQWTQHYQLTSGFYGYGLNWQWKSDGLQYYFMGDNDEVIHEMKPTTAWSVGSSNSGNENTFKNTAKYVDFCHPYKLFNVQSNYALRWVDDGNKIAYTAGYSTYLYSAGTPYDMKTLSTSGQTYKSLSGVGYGPQELTYNSTGTVLFWGPEIQYKEVRQYNLSTGWDASTINTTAAHTLDLTAGGGPSSVNCGTVSDDGKYIYAAYSSTIYQWTLSTPFDLSTASYTHSQSGFESSSGSVKISPDGTQLLQMKGTTIKSYTLGTAFNIQTASYDNKSCTIDHTLSTMIPEGFSWQACMHVVPVTGAAKLTFMPYYGAIGISISFS